MKSSKPMDRRTYLKGAGVAIAALGGCSAPSDGGRTDATTSRGDDGASPSPSATESTDAPEQTASESESEPAAAAAEAYPWFTERGSVVADFSSFDADWTVGAGHADSVSEGFLGGGAVKMGTGDGSRARIDRRFAEPRDFSDRDFSLAVNLRSTTAEMFRVEVVLQDVSGNLRYHSNAILPSATDTWIHFDMAFDREEGAFDPTAVSELWIHQWTGEGSSEFLVDDLRTLPKPDTGAVLFTFDDAGAGEHEYALPVLSEYDFAGVAFPPSSYVAETSEPSIGDYQEMSAAGWDIGGHTPSHQRLSEFSAAEQRRIFERNVEELRSMGLVDDDDPLHFRTPYGNYDTSTLEVVLETFDDCIAGAGTAAGTSFNLTDRRMISFRSGETLSGTKQLVDAAAAQRQLLGLTFHTKNIDRDYLETVVDYVDQYVQQGDLRVLTMSEYYEEAFR
jgi:peptidoglycan/xylan/chitin deacetylase (PgdA/CDA1 family)